MIETFAQIAIVQDDIAASVLVAADGHAREGGPVDDVELARYVYRPDTVQVESPKPYIHPLRTLAGRTVSLFRPHDHVWHKGLSLAFPNVGPHNFWGGPTYTRRAGWYEQLPNNGTQGHVETLEVDGAAFAHRLEWRAEDGALVFVEERRLRARVVAEGAWALRWESALQNVSGGELVFGSPTTEGRENAGYGGLFWRGPREFSSGQVVTPEGLLDAEEARGTRHDWMAYVGRHDGDGASSTILIADCGGNPGGRPKWFVRAEPFACLGPAPFFDEELPLADGASLALAYDVVVADGASDPERAAALVAAAGAA